MTPTLTFTCSICGEPSVSICVYCTKDACPNHLCERCGRCSDCCECEIPLDEHPEPVHQYVMEAEVSELPVNGDHELPVDVAPPLSAEQWTETAVEPPSAEAAMAGPLTEQQPAAEAAHETGDQSEPASEIEKWAEGVPQEPASEVAAAEQAIAPALHSQPEEPQPATSDPAIERWAEGLSPAPTPVPAPVEDATLPPLAKRAPESDGSEAVDNTGDESPEPR